MYFKDTDSQGTISVATQGTGIRSVMLMARDYSLSASSPGPLISSFHLCSHLQTCSQLSQSQLRATPNSHIAASLVQENS